MLYWRDPNTYTFYRFDLLDLKESIPVSEMLAEDVCWLKGYSLFFSFLLPLADVVQYRYVCECDKKVDMEKKKSMIWIVQIIFLKILQHFANKVNEKVQK